VQRFLLIASPIVLFAAFAGSCGDGDGDDVHNVTVPPAGPVTGINVTGEGRVTVEPDLARLNLGVEVTEDNADLALVNANGAMENLMSVLDEAGVADEDIQTTGITVQPIYNYNGPTPVIESYVASNTVDVKVRDLESLGEIIDGVTNAAGNAVRVNYINFEREDDEEAIAQAREQAVEDAHSRAEALADGAGVGLGDLQSLTETSFNQPPPIPFAERDLAEGEAADEAAVQTPVNPGTLEISVTVAAVYGIDQ
jgi:uncharacterized protein YggE